MEMPDAAKPLMIRERTEQFVPVRCKPLGNTLGGVASAPLMRMDGPFGFELTGSVLPSSTVARARPGKPSVGWMLKTLLLNPGSDTGMLKVMVVPGWSNAQ